MCVLGETCWKIEELVEFLAEVNAAPNSGFPYYIAFAEVGIGNSATTLEILFLVVVGEIVFVIGINDVLGEKSSS